MALPAVRLAYLDLSHWIMLSKAMAGHPDGDRYEPVLAACLSASTTGQVLFPLSDSTFAEVAKIGTYRQRRHLREVMEALSNYFVVMSRPDISAHEIECLLDDVIGPSRAPVNTMDYLDRGVARAFGMAGGFCVYDEHGEDVTASARSSFSAGPDAFDAALAAADLQLQRSVLDGPANTAEEQELSSLGWRPGGSAHIAEQRRRQEAGQALVFDGDPRWRRQRIRDVTAAREILIELDGTLSRSLEDRGATFEDLGTTIGERREMFDSLPSFDVAVTLKASYHRDPNHRWTVNDIYDIDAMGSVVPYCDFVVSDREVVSHIKRAHLDERLGTKVIATLDELADAL